jgi:hypothetical protein
LPATSIADSAITAVANRYGVGGVWNNTSVSLKQTSRSTATAKCSTTPAATGNN